MRDPLRHGGFLTPGPSRVDDEWSPLRAFTDARIALGRAGESLPTCAHLEFQLAHARARDAVHLPLDENRLQAELAERFTTVLAVRSAAPDRLTYLRRPDLGRRLDPAAQQHLEALDVPPSDVVIMVGDGLSARAVNEHALAFVDAVREELSDWNIGTCVVVRHARVAITDPIGLALHARIGVMILGERPGLSAADSLGIYVTWQPRLGRTDAERNCISNVRPGGQSPATAAHRLGYLLHEMRRLGTGGVGLKDQSRVIEGSPTLAGRPPNLLLGGG
jgi:ethanolamine ammonia-lyase small subunit